MVRRSEKRNDSMWLETSCHGPHVHARFDELRRGEMTEVVQPRTVEFEPVADPAEESGDVVRAELRGAVNDGREHERIVGQFFALAVKPRPPIRSRQCTAHRLCVSATGSRCRRASLKVRYLRDYADRWTAVGRSVRDCCGDVEDVGGSDQVADLVGVVAW